MTEPREIECPDCRGEGWVHGPGPRNQDDGPLRQCDRCHGWTLVPNPAYEPDEEQETAT